MPIYEYRCQKCGAQFEELTSSSQEAAVRCRSCSSRRVARMLSAFAVHASAPTLAPAAAEAGPCGSCGAARRGMCATAE